MNYTPSASKIDPVVYGEFQRLGVLLSFNIADAIQVRNRPTTKFKDGQVAIQDGVNWNPAGTGTKTPIWFDADTNTWKSMGGGGGGSPPVTAIQPGHGIKVDITDPTKPIVSVDKAADYTWTGMHLFQGAVSYGPVIGNAAVSIGYHASIPTQLAALVFHTPAGSVDERVTSLHYRTDSKTLNLEFVNDAINVGRYAWSATRGTGTAVVRVDYGNNVNWPRHVFYGAPTFDVSGITGNYSEGIRLVKNNNDYSGIFLAADASGIGTIDGQWSILRVPAKNLEFWTGGTPQASLNPSGQLRINSTMIAGDWGLGFAAGEINKAGFAFYTVENAMIIHGRNAAGGYPELHLHGPGLWSPATYLNAGAGGQRYGCFSAAGANNGWSGISFYAHALDFMFNIETQGVHHCVNGWQWNFSNGTLGAGTVPYARMSGIGNAATYNVVDCNGTTAAWSIPVISGDYLNLFYPRITTGDSEYATFAQMFVCGGGGDSHIRKASVDQVRAIMGVLQYQSALSGSQSSGYFIFTNSFKIMWGAYVQNGNAYTTVYYPTSFSQWANAVIACVGPVSNTAQDNPPNVQSSYTTYFQTWNAQDNASSAWYIAVGI